MRRDHGRGCRHIQMQSQVGLHLKAYDSVPCRLAACCLTHLSPALPPPSQLLVRDRSGNARSVTLTGWTALAGIAAFIVLIMWGVAYAWRRYRGGPASDGYTLVVKKPLRS